MKAKICRNVDQEEAGWRIQNLRSWRENSEQYVWRRVLFCKAQVESCFCCMKTWFSVDGPSFLVDRASALLAVPSPSDEVISTSTDLKALTHPAPLGAQGSCAIALDSASPQDLAQTSLWHLCRLLPQAWLHKSCGLSPQVHLRISFCPK